MYNARKVQERKYYKLKYRKVKSKQIEIKYYKILHLKMIRRIYEKLFKKNVFIYIHQNLIMIYFIHFCLFLLVLNTGP